MPSFPRRQLSVFPLLYSPLLVPVRLTATPIQMTTLYLCPPPLFSKLLPNSSFHTLIMLFKVHQGLLFAYRVQLRFHDLTSSTSSVFSLATLLPRYAPRFQFSRHRSYFQLQPVLCVRLFGPRSLLCPLRLSARQDPDSRVSHVIQNNSSSVGK